MEIIRKVDEIGKPAWIGLLVLTFVIYWPLGAALLAFLIWSGRMGCCRAAGAGRRHGYHHRHGRWYRERGSSGNLAFDEYRAETLRRLEDEQREFKEFLDRLRHAKDKAEFDQFMAERRRPKPASDDSGSDRPSGGEPR
ncbi:MAG TPA: DUF2852 domain-containing protein [Gammaproteobacteria bacterium]|nr:DUF2852 domain-containing protein [Gammaproteobacteria bacterium]